MLLRTASKIICRTAPRDFCPFGGNKSPFCSGLTNVMQLPRTSKLGLACVLGIGLAQNAPRQPQDKANGADTNRKHDACLWVNQGRFAPEHPPTTLRQYLVQLPYSLNNVRMRM